MEKSCSRCKQVLDISNFYTSNGKINSWCKVCWIEYTKEYTKKHPRKKELVNAANKRFYENHKEQSYENSKKWRAENKEAYQELNRNYYQEHKDIIKERAKKFYIENKERILEDAKVYRKNNLDHIKKVKKEYNKEHVREKRIRENYRRAKKKNNGGMYTAKEWDDLCEKYNNKCLGCNKDNVKLTADHVIPISQGGSNNIDNIQPLCASCNSIKSIKTIDYRY
jgi:5-methylcytosine-specific restriction endonuclease McrA